MRIHQYNTLYSIVVSPDTMDQTPVQPQIQGVSDKSKFFSLNYDIRYMIWQLSVPGPRIVEPQRTRFPDTHLFPRWLSIRCPPTVLQICQESRRETLKHYIFCHNNHMRVYLNPSIDTLYFGPAMKTNDFKTFLQFAFSEDLSAVRRLAIDFWELQWWTDWKGDKFSRILDDLETLYVSAAIESKGYPVRSRVRSEVWEDWCQQKGTLTIEEEGTLTESNPNMVMMAHSRDKDRSSTDPQLFRNPPKMALSAHVWNGKHFRVYHNKELLSAKHRPQRSFVSSILPGNEVFALVWYRKVRPAAERIDLYVKRIFEVHEEKKDDGTGRTGQFPKVVSFYRPNESCLSWRRCLEIVGESHFQWLS